MTNEERKQLTEKMPYLIPRNAWTGKIVEDYDYSYIEGEYSLPPGWFKLFLLMCEEIREPLEKANLLDTFYFTQIKEKFDTMRTYTNTSTAEINDIMSRYEYISYYICQDCGQIATKATNGYIASFCDTCFEKFDAEWGGNTYTDIKIEPIYKYTRFSNEGNQTFEEDCTYILDKLYK